MSTTDSPDCTSAKSEKSKLLGRQRCRISVDVAHELGLEFRQARHAEVPDRRRNLVVHDCHEKASDRSALEVRVEEGAERRGKWLTLNDLLRSLLAVRRVAVQEWSTESDRLGT